MLFLNSRGSLYRDQLSKLSVHVEIASNLNTVIEEGRLAELGKLEQDVVFGDVSSKEVLAYYTANGANMPWQDRVRDLIILWILSRTGTLQ